ncbi:MAG: hypothetical protein ACYDB1_03720 [Acidiferrobacteraceae bacterium]
MKKVFPDFLGWGFERDEVSAGIYEVMGTDAAGHRVSVKGIDLDAVIEEGKGQTVLVYSNAGRIQR